MGESSPHDALTRLAESVRDNRDLLAIVPAGIVLVRVDGAVLAANQEALDVLGLSYDEATARYTNDWEPETVWEDGSPCAAADYPVSRALMTGQPQPSVVIGIKRPDGHLVWAEFRAVPTKGADGEVTGAVVTFLDVTQRKKAQDAQRDVDATLASVLRSVPDQIFLLETDGRIAFANRILGNYTEEQVIGANFLDFVGPESSRLRGYLDRVVRHGETIRYDLEWPHEDAVIHWSSVLAPVVRDGRVERVVLVAADRTAERERGQLAAQLARAERLEAVGRLASGVAHDFNNLLTIVHAGCERLARELDDSPQTQVVARIARASERATELTRKLLAFGRRQVLRPSPTRIHALLEQSREMIDTLVGDHVRVVVDLAAPTDAALVDPGELERVMLNLAANARDAMPDGGVLTVRTAERHVAEGEHPNLQPGAYLTLEFIDQGHGMDDATLARVFEPFFSTKEWAEGSGLGLASAHGIVSQSGGWLTAKSEPGVGSTFTILLPRHAAPDATAAPSRRRVLVVDDNAALRRVTTEILESAGYAVIAIGDAEEVLDTHADDLAAADLVITDMAMPNLDGLELVAQVAARHPGKRVLFVSGHADRDVPTGPDRSFLAKPFDAVTLLSAVAELLGR